jgi:hypothetical protein
MKFRSRPSLVAGLGAALALGISSALAQVDDLRRRATVIKPAAAELKWRQIPWVLDLTEGLRTAREERRPIFLWVTGDDPLERC